MTSLRVLHVAETAKGGVGTYLAEALFFQLKWLGPTQLRVLVPASDAKQLSGVDRRVIRTWRRRARSFLNLMRLAIAFRLLVRRFRPSVVHAHSSLAGVVVRLLYGWRRRPFRIVYCPHGWAFDRRSSSVKNRLIAAIERRLARWCDQIVVISAHERDIAIAAGIPAERLTLIHNGVGDVAGGPAARWDDPRLKLLFVGRLDRQKGIDTLLDAIEPLADRVCLRVIGRAVANGAEPLRGGRHIERLGWRTLAEITTEIAAADVVMVPSRWEGFGLVAAEAMRGGRAVVASAVGGLPELVVDGVTGRLLPPDAPAEWLHVLGTTTRAEWQAMGLAGRARYLQLFTAERLDRQLFGLYAQLCPGIGRGAEPAERPDRAAVPIRHDAYA